MSTEPILVLCRDLMFASKISATAQSLGVQISIFRDVSKLGDQTGRLIVDLNQDGFLIAAADWKRRTNGHVIGFVGHVDAEKIAAARAEGLDQIYPRSVFVVKLDQILTA